MGNYTVDDNRFDYGKYRENKIRELFENRSWGLEDLREVDNNSTTDKVDLIWKLNEWLKEDQTGKYLEDAMKIAEIYHKDSDPPAGDSHDKDVRKGDDVRYIYTVKGTLPYLLSTIISKLHTELYSRLIDILDILLADENAYVRMHATITLSSFAAIVYATKNADGSPFNFPDTERARIQPLAFRTLQANHKLPRVLEFLAGAFNWLRRMNEADARVALENFIFSDLSKKEYQPTYLLRDISALLIYYAEFRTQLSDNFNPESFRSLLRDCLQNGPSEFRSSIIWHFWKTIEEDPKNLEKLKTYIPDFFQGDFENHYVQQLSLFTEHVLKADADVGVKTYQMLVDFVLEKMNHTHGVLWFLDMDRIVPLIAEHRPELYVDTLEKLKQLLLRKNIFIADYQRVFTAYSAFPSSKRKQIREKAQVIYKDLQRLKGDLPDLTWPE